MDIESDTKMVSDFFVGFGEYNQCDGEYIIFLSNISRWTANILVTMV